MAVDVAEFGDALVVELLPTAPQVRRQREGSQLLGQLLAGEDMVEVAAHPLPRCAPPVQPVDVAAVAAGGQPQWHVGDDDHREHQRLQRR